MVGDIEDLSKDLLVIILMTEDEMVGWHHRLDEHEFEQAPGKYLVRSLAFLIF